MAAGEESRAVREFNKAVGRLIKDSDPEVVAEALVRRDEVSQFHIDYARILQGMSVDDISEILVPGGGGELGLWDDNVNNNNPPKKVE